MSARDNNAANDDASSLQNHAATLVHFPDAGQVK
jgi:hypothetical protein